MINIVDSRFDMMIFNTTLKFCMEACKVSDYRSRYHYESASKAVILEFL